MIKVFKEHPEFGQFTKVDTDEGRLVDITETEFASCLPEGYCDSGTALERLNGRGAVVFTGETPPTHTRFPRRIYFQITRCCNLSCDYCCLKAKPGQLHVPTTAVLEMADFLAAHGLIEVRLTGGEPTTHPDFFAILHRFRKAGVYVSVATNGLLNQHTMDQLSQERNLWLICSLDGNRATHNRYRPSSFDLIVRNLRCLRERNPSLRLRLTTVLTRENKGQMRDLGKLCRTLGAESITIIPLRPQVRNPALLSDMVTAEEFQRVIEDLVIIRRETGIRFTTTLETDYAGSIYKDPVFRKRSACAAGREGTNLDYDARTGRFLLYGCSYSPASDLDAPASVRRPFLAGEFPVYLPERLLDCWRDETAWTLFRDLTLKALECKRCDYFTQHRCVGSCPIQNLNYDRLDLSGNVLAQLRHQIEHTSEWYCYQRILGDCSGSNQGLA